MDDLAQELAKESDEWVIMRLEHQLRILNKLVIREEGEVFSLDTLIAKAREQRREKLREGKNGMKKTGVPYRGIESTFTDAPPQYAGARGPIRGSFGTFARHYR
jgi:hypothetical protein